MRLRIEPFLYALAASTTALLLAQLLGQDVLQRALYMARFTARAGVPLVLVIYTASSLHRLWPGQWTAWLSRNRRSLGLAFALTHTVHLAAILNYIAQPGSPPQPAAGIVGYAVIYLMAFSSNPGSIKQLGRWWHRLHAAGVQIVFLYYLVGYASMVFEPELRPLGLTVVPLLLAALALRIAAWRTRRVAGGAA
jgi:DMSO/TMAO reductase YedYZ heme-binding membrane subunit